MMKFLFALLTRTFVATLTTSAAVHAAAIPSAPSKICIEDSSGPSSCANISDAKKKWNPGHYVRANAWGFASHWSGGRQRAFDLIRNQSLFKGGSIPTPWGMLEPQKGKYDFSQIDHDLAYLKAMGKRLIIEVWWARNDAKVETVGMSGDRFFPDWMIAEGGVQARGGGHTVKLQEKYWMDRYILLQKALAARYDNDPYVEQITSGELDGMTSANEFKRAIPEIAAIWPHTSFILWMNWVDSPEMARDLMAICASSGVGVGGPDTLPPPTKGLYEDHGSRALRGAGWGQLYQGSGGSSGDFGSIDYRGRIPVSYQYQELHNISPANLIGYSQDTLRSTHITWMATEAAWLTGYTVPQELHYSTGVLPTIQANPNAIHTQCPTAFVSGCTSN